MMNQLDTLNCLIVEDELICSTHLSNYCEKVGGLNVVDTTDDPVRAQRVCAENDIDILFLDIHLPEINGFEFLSTLKCKPKVIVTTSDENCAIDAFDNNASDFLLKPIKYSRFIMAINKIREDRIEELPKEKRDHFYVKLDGRLVRINHDSLLVIEARGDYIYLKTEEKNYLVHSTLKAIQSKLPDEKFLKVHRSYIINRDKIVDIEDNSILIHQNVVPISRSNKEFVMSTLNVL
ncbi:MAG: LytTR family DNA-binding domain-containing protein [Bacteroidota bacterium]